nr:MAG TPA: hypothetical protein [Caudoviricetes sp.]
MNELENKKRWARNRFEFMVRDAERIKRYLDCGELKKAEQSERFFKRNLLELNKLEKELKND